MMQDLEKRVVDAEWKLTLHEKELSELKATSNVLTTALGNIQDTLNQIKWVAFGALGCFVALEMGWFNALSLFFS